MNLRKIIVVVAAATFSLSIQFAKAAEKETTLIERNGVTTVITTDVHGTYETQDGHMVSSSGSDKHKEYVERAERSGARIISNVKFGSE